MRIRHERPLVLATVLLLLTACSSSHPQGLNSTQTLRQYRAAQAGLSLAPGATWPAGYFPHDTVYEDGIGKERADGVWICSWEAAFLKPGNTPTQRSHALAELQTVKGMFLYRSGFDANSRASMDSELNKAALGDPSAIESDYHANCGPAQ
jgi:hypothetical protein